MPAFSLMSSLLAVCSLRSKTSGSFPECGHAALVEADRPVWAVFSRVQMAEMPRFALT